MTLLSIETHDGRCTLTLQRPDIHNALNDELIDALAAGLAEAASDEAVRYVVLAGAGKSFCAGADLNWMKRVVTGSIEDNRADAARLVGLLESMVTCPKPIIARVHGAALGGGMGLVSACDLVAAAPRALFGLTEVRLGLVPAMIFPFLMRRVQRHRLLEAALTGERFRADRALELGLVNEVHEQVDRIVDTWGASLMASGPQALGLVKQLFDQVPKLPWDDANQMTTQMIAQARRSDEGQEGMRAFLEGRKPRWAPPQEN